MSLISLFECKHLVPFVFLCLAIIGISSIAVRKNCQNCMSFHLSLMSPPSAGTADGAGPGHSQDKKPGLEYQPGEQVSLKERLAMYQAAVTKKETGGSSSAAVR